MDNAKLADLLQSIDVRLTGLEHTVNDVIVKTLVDSADEYDREVFGEKLNGIDGYGDTASKLKTLYGDDYDLSNELYDASRGVEDVDSFVAEQLQEINDKLNALVGTSPAAEETAPVEEPPVEEEDIANMPDEQLNAELQAAK